MKKLLLLLLLFLTAVSVRAYNREESDRGKKLITEALEASKRFSYITKISLKDPQNKAIDTGVFYRLVDDSGAVFN